MAGIARGGVVVSPKAHSSSSSSVETSEPISCCAAERSGLSLTTRSSLPLTKALSPRQQQHATTVWHPKTTTQRSSFCMRGEIEEAEVDGDVEDTAMEVPVQPTASTSSSSATPAKKLTALYCAQPRLRHGQEEGVLNSIVCACPAAVSGVARMEIDPVSKAHRVPTWPHIFTTSLHQQRNTFRFGVGSISLSV